MIYIHTPITLLIVLILDKYICFVSLFVYVHNLSEFSNENCQMKIHSGYLQRKIFHKKKIMNYSKIKNVKKEMINVCVRITFLTKHLSFLG